MAYGSQQTLPLMPGLSIFISCEHAGNQVPVRYRSLFTSEEVLNSHRGWDPGALDIAVALSEELDLPCFTHQTTRLLVEVNRSLGHPQLFSEFSQPLGDEDKQLLLDKYYFPYRLRVENALTQLTKPVLHLSIHSFTPVLNEKVRLTDIGILFDPTRAFENSLSEKLLNSLQQILPGLRIEFNEPYKGIDDGFTTYLRTRFTDEEYAGIEIEVNQKVATGDELEKIIAALRASILSLHS
jgi:predicted N-formylglutamate amidohydrolase